MNYTRIFDILPQLIKHNKSLPDLYARREDKKTWTKYSTKTTYETIQKVSRGLLELGLQEGDKVAIISTTNRPEWNFIDQGCLQIGVVDVPVYPTISPAEYEFIFNDSEIKYVFLSDRMIYKKVALVADKIPTLKGIYTFDEIEGVSSWKSILKDKDEELDKEISN